MCFRPSQSVLPTALLIAVIASCSPATSEPTKKSGEAATSKAKVTTAPQVVTPQELSEGFVALFDGETLFGWQSESNANWQVDGQTIKVDSGDPGLLCTTAEFSDYVLRFEFQAPADTNSGVFLHTPAKPKDPETDCYELNIAGSDNPFPTGSLVKRAKAEAEVKPNEWHRVEATVAGDHVIVKVDDKQLVDYTDKQPLRRGRIGLQLNKGPVAFRNIRLKPLNLTEMFNGRDLTGWKTYPDLPSRFTVKSDGALNVKNGKGQLESEKSYADFVMQLECITNAPELNSGVFFRSVPGSPMDGYESQIHNGVKDGDRAQPKDCGTGGVFRRQNARLVVADDGKWFSKTLIVNGPHVSAWVNGYQVTDWTDAQAPHENPRKGCRLQAGTIMLQGHDATTDISFRNLLIAELATRSEPAGK